MKTVSIAGWILCAILTISGCTPSEKKGGDAKKTLSDYISKSFAVRAIDDRNELLKYMTGDAKTRLSSWSEEQFRQAFIETKRQFVKLSFKDEKTPSPTQLLLTYELTYLDQNKSFEAKITNKKLATLVQENGQWFISDVKNIKELIEYKDELSLP